MMLVENTGVIEHLKRVYIEFKFLSLWMHRVFKLLFM